MSLLSGVTYLYVFLQSAGLEAIYLRLVIRKRPEHLWKKVFLINSITHPLVVFGFMSDGWFTNISAIALAESFAVLSETALIKIMFKNLTKSQAFVLSLSANLISWQLAPYLTYFTVKTFL